MFSTRYHTLRKVDGRLLYMAGVVLKDGSKVLGDLVVDAAGRASKVPQWLRDSGVHVSSPETVGSGLHYSSRRYRRPANWPKVLTAALL